MVLDIFDGPFLIWVQVPDIHTASPPSPPCHNLHEAVHPFFGVNHSHYDGAARSSQHSHGRLLQWPRLLPRCLQLDEGGEVPWQQYQAVRYTVHGWARNF